MGDRAWMHDDSDRAGPTRGLVGLTSWLDRNFSKLIVAVMMLGTAGVLLAVLTR